jgi:hypothetical protein
MPMGLGTLGREKPGIVESRKSKELVAVTGVLTRARLRPKGRMNLTLRQTNGVDVPVFFRGGRPVLELFVLLQERDRLEVTGQPRQTGGIRGKSVRWIDLSERDLSERRMQGRDRLRALLAAM